MKTIACGKCGTKFDATNLKPGVKFKCSNCQAVVEVPAHGVGPVAAGKRPTGGLPKGKGKRATGVMPGKATRGPVAAGGPVGARQAPGMVAAGGPQGERPQFGPPKKSNSTGLIVGGIVGVVALGLILVIVFSSGGPSQHEVAQQRADERQQEREQAARQRQEEADRQARIIDASLSAAMDYGTAIEAALRNEDRTTLESMFDWDIYAAYIANLAEENSIWLTYPLRAEGAWEKNEEGRFSGRYAGTTTRGASSLRGRVMDYIGEYMFGRANIRWDRGKTELDAAAFTLVIRDVTYLGRRIYIDADGAGGTKEFFVGAPRGETNVRILYYNDGSANRTLRDNEARNERQASVEEDRGQGGGYFREGYDPSHRDPRGGGDNPRDPEHGGGEVEFDPDAELPPMGKTNNMPTQPQLVNCVNDLRRLGSLNEARRGQIRQEPSNAQKKATMGAFIDLLIDAVQANDRNAKHRISNELWTIWRSFVPADLGRDKMVFDVSFGGGQSADELVVRRWLLVHSEYPVD